MPRSLSSEKRPASSRVATSSSPRRAPTRSPVKKTTVARTVPLRTVERRSTAVDHEAHQEQSAEPRVLTFQEGIVDPYHKQQLIRAHTEARRARHHPRHRWMLTVGLGMACVLLAGGWWLTVGTWMRGQMSRRTQAPGLAEQIRQETVRLEQKYGLSSANTPPLAELLPTTTGQGEVRQDTPTGDR